MWRWWRCTSVHQQPGLMDHRGDGSKPVDEEYGLAPGADHFPGGLLNQILAGLDFSAQAPVHGQQAGQGVNRLAPGLKVEALADGG